MNGSEHKGRQVSSRIRVVFGVVGVIAGVVSLFLAYGLALAIAQHKPGGVVFAGGFLFVLIAFLSLGYLGKMITGDLRWPFGRILPGYRAWMIRLLEGKRYRTPQPQSPDDPGEYQAGSYSVASWNVMSIVAFVAAFFASVAAVICGHISLHQIKRTGQRGRGLALLAVILGYVETGVFVLVLVVSAAIALSGPSS